MTGLTVLFRIIGIVFFAEGLIMYGFSFSHISSPEVATVIDAVLLVALTSPLIFVFAIKPYVSGKTRELIRSKKETVAAKNLAEKEEARLVAVFNGIPDGIVFTDTDRRIISANRGMENTFGYIPDDLTGKKISVLYESEEEYENQGRLRFSLATEEKSAPYEVNYCRKNGEAFVGETLGATIKDPFGKALGYVRVIRDISDRKEAELMLLESEKRFKALSDASFGGIIIHEQGRILDCNKGLSDITGFSRPELIGMDGYNLITPNTLDLVLANVKRNYEGSYEVEGIRKDGSVYPLSIRGKGTSYQGHKVRVTEFRDETKSNEVKEELRKALVDAERANQSKSEFLASMSHELRTPLNAVLGFAQMMQFDPNNPLTPCQQEHTENIIEGGQHLLELVNEILDLARVEADQHDLTLCGVEANGVIANCVNLLTPVAGQRNIKIIDQFSGQPPVFVYTDKVRFKQILINLLSNASKFNKDGGTISIDGQETDHGYLRLSVTDTGIGIAEQDGLSIFNLFHRLDADSMVAREGTGIGLTVSKKLIERMAGRIDFKSKEGVGSTFWIDLPLASNDDVWIWTKAMQTDVDGIDKDHQVLVSMLNRVMRRSVNDEDVDEIIDGLIDYTLCHFNREEAIMETCGYPNIERHSELHRALVASVKVQAEAWQKDRSQEKLVEFRKFLKNWLFDHIMKEDTKITAFAKGKDREIRKALEDL